MQRHAGYLLEEMRDVFGGRVRRFRELNPYDFALSPLQIGGNQWAKVMVVPSGWPRGSFFLTRFENDGSEWQARTAQVTTMGSPCPKCHRGLSGLFGYGASDVGEPWRLQPLERGFCCDFLRQVCIEYYLNLPGQ